MILVRSHNRLSVIYLLIFVKPTLQLCTGHPTTVESPTTGRQVSCLWPAFNGVVEITDVIKR